MRLADVKAAVRDVIAADWDAAACPIVYPNENADPSAAGWQAWAWVEVTGDDTDGSGYGSAGKRMVTEVGTIIAHVFVATGTGEEVGDQIARDFGNLFRGRKVGPADTLHPGLTELDGRSRTSAPPDNGNFYRAATVSVPWTVSYSA